MSELDEVLDAHAVGASTGSEMACRCDRTWRTNAAYRAHLRDAILAAGFIHLKDETDREYHFNGDEAEEVWVDKP